MINISANMAIDRLSDSMPDVKDLKDLAEDSTRVDEFDPSQFRSAVIGETPADKPQEEPPSPFENNGVSGFYKTVHGVDLIDARVGRWEDRKLEKPYDAQMDTHKVRVTGERVFFPGNSTVPNLHLFYIEGDQFAEEAEDHPAYGRKWESPHTHEMETEVALDQNDRMFIYPIHPEEPRQLTLDEEMEKAA